MQALLEFLSRFLEQLRPWQTVKPWEASLRVRFGKYTKGYEPGLHFKLPVFDEYHSINVVPRVVPLPHQSLKTSDGKNLALAGALAYSISDVEKVLVEVDDHDESLVNLAMGLLAYYVSNNPIAACTHDAIQDSVAVVLREAAAEWGIEVSHIYLTDLSDARTFRLLNDTNPSKAPTLTISST